jgi:hypothetical protein
VVIMVNKLNTSWSHVDLCKFGTHLRSLNTCHSEWLKVQDKKLWCQGHHQRHDLPDEFNENLPTGSKVTGGGQIETDSMVIS